VTVAYCQVETSPIRQAAWFWPAPFSLDTLAVTGPATPILEGVTRGYPATGATQYVVSANGTLVYVPGPAVLVETGRSLATYAMDGSATRLGVRADTYEFPRVSPDGASLAVGTNSDGNADIWIVDLSGKFDRRRVTLEGAIAFRSGHPTARASCSSRLVRTAAASTRRRLTGVAGPSA
jgi:hypothetical protein